MGLLKIANKYFMDEKYIEAFEYYKKAYLKYPEIQSIILFNMNMVLEKTDSKKLLEELRLLKNTSIAENSNECILRLENIHKGLVSGWAIDKKEHNNTVVLETFIDGSPYSIIETAALREDVKKAYGGDGYYGFRGEVNQYLTFSNESFFSISPINYKIETNSLNYSKKMVQLLLKGKHFDNPNLKAEKLAKKYLVESPVINEVKSVSVSVIILNLNGSEVLFDCLTSLIKWNENIEIIVIDHASTDNSVEMINSFNNDNIIVIERDKNYSYSESNNLGASQATGEVLIFLNNDIVLTSDSISYMENVIRETDFGLLGIKLWDLPKNKNFSLSEDIKVNQHLGVHFNCTNRNETIEAFELRNSSFIELEQGILETPAVTAAMMAITKMDFLQLNGFSEKYFYGQEDVDFCLRYGQLFDKKIGVVLEHGAYHIRGLSRKGLSQKNTSYISNNKKIIQSELGAYFREKFRQDKILKPGFWNHKPTSVAMIVSEVSFETDKADFFTAKELGDVFDEDEKYTVGYFDTSSDYDMSGYDIIIVYIDGLNPENLKNISPHTQLIAWARNWFDRWCEREWIEMYDIIYASSEYARNFMEEKLKRKVHLLRIAASNSCIDIDEDSANYKSDYVFTGSYFNSPREITSLLNPKSIPYNFKLYGYSWEEHPKFKNYTSGPVSYKDIPNVYANTKLVVDDANIATKQWGALNCRIYDSLASGTLCITNNEMGIKEIFDENFPIYDNVEINNKISNILNDDDYRLSLSDKYKKIVLEEHTYYKRKEQIVKDVEKNLQKKSIAIKIAAPDLRRAQKWGDYHFAIEVRKEFESLGYKVRIDCLNEWNGYRSLNDDINIVFRGLNNFRTRDDQLNIMWLISHPDLVSEVELKNYNYIFIASKKYLHKLMGFLEIDNLEYLPQASAFQVDTLDEDILKKTPEHDILFIGNSRNVYREVVKWCVEKNLPISIYGGGWNNLVPAKYIKSEFLDNSLLPYYYKKAKLVLNDHWDDMRSNGFISNRIYDILSVGGRLLTDNVVGIEEIKSENLYVYKDKKDFYSIIDNILQRKQNDIYQDSQIESYSFTNRVLEIDEVISELMDPKSES